MDKPALKNLAESFAPWNDPHAKNRLVTAEIGMQVSSSINRFFANASMKRILRYFLLK